MNRIKYVISLSLMISVSFVTLGCGESSTGTSASTSQKFAVVSFKEVANESGLSEQLRKIAKQQEENDKQIMGQRMEAMQAEFEKKRQEYGDTPTEAQLTELKQFQNYIAVQKNQGTQRIRQNQYLLEQRMLDTLREQVRPIAMEIAKEQGYSIVFERDQRILAFSEAVNISQEVVIRLKEQNQTGSIATTPGENAAPNGKGNTTPELEGNGDNLDLLTNPGGDGASKKTPKDDSKKPEDKSQDNPESSSKTDTKPSGKTDKEVSETTKEDATKPTEDANGDKADGDKKEDSVTAPTTETETNESVNTGN